jgi:N-acetylglucosamine kinase-like BadF-type ATPase
MARNSDGQYFRAGGYGPQIGDEGSAYDVGRRAVLASLRERDRTGEDCPLGHRILAHLGNRTWPEIQQSISAAPDEVFPRVFPIVALAAEDHDELARILLRDAARELAAIVRIVAMRAGLQGTPFLIAKNGGMLGRSAFFDAHLDRELREAEPKARMGVFADLAETAARLALRHLSQAGAAGH